MSAANSHLQTAPSNHPLNLMLHRYVKFNVLKNFNMTTHHFIYKFITVKEKWKQKTNPHGIELPLINSNHKTRLNSPAVLKSIK